MKNRILSIITALALCLSLCPVRALAEDSTINMDYSGFVFANGIPIVIRENNGITSIYHANSGALLSGASDVSGCAIYGGWYNGTYTASTSIMMESGTVQEIFGGNCLGSLTGSTNIAVNGGMVAGSVFGGGNQDTVTGNTSVTLSGGTIGWAYGGGSYSDVRGTARVTVNSGAKLWGQKVADSSAEAKGTAFGGGYDGSVINTEVVFNGGDMGWIYGGGQNCACTNTNLKLMGQPEDYMEAYGGGYGGSVQKAVLEFYGNGTSPGNQVMGIFGSGWNDTVDEVQIIIGKDSSTDAVTFYANCPDSGSTVRNASFDIALTHDEVNVNPRLNTLDGIGVDGTVSAYFHGDGIGATQMFSPTMLGVTEITIDNCQFVLNGTVGSDGKRVLALDRLEIGPSGVAVFSEFNDVVTIGELAGSGKILFIKNFHETSLTSVTVEKIMVSDEAHMTIAYQGSEMSAALEDGFAPLQGNGVKELGEASCFDVELDGFVVVYKDGQIITQKESDQRKQASILNPYRDKSSYIYGDTMIVTLSVGVWEQNTKTYTPILGAVVEVLSDTIDHIVGAGKTDGNGNAVISVPVNDAVWMSQSGLSVQYQGDENYKPNNYGLSIEGDGEVIFTVSPANIALDGTITAPSYNKVPDTALNVDPSAFYTAQVVWTPADAQFQAGVAYHAAIRLIPKAGYSLSNDRIGTITFNGKTLTPAGALEPDGSLLLPDAAVFDPIAVPPSSGSPGNSGSSGSSGGSGGSSSNYTVTVGNTTHGSVKVDPTKASSGSTVTLTVTPDSGYMLDTLTVADNRGNEIQLTDKGNNQYTFIMPSGAVTIKASFVPIPDDAEKRCDGGVDCLSHGFTDIGSAGTWYHEAVDYVLRHGLMSGYNDSLFGPDNPLTRAQLAQILYNKEGKPSVSGSSIFSDVADGAWYCPAVTWAAANGFVNGYGNGLFGPDDNITREQLTVMLWRYKGSPAAFSEELPFSDAGEISGYAVDAMRWAVENGIVNGYGDGQLNPKGLATRAQTAQMLKNFLDG